ncbi:MAG: glycosyltransferase family 39 protein [Gaiellaceae bacterium]
MRNSETRPIALGALALLVGALAEALLVRAGWREAGFALLIAAMALGVAAWGRRGELAELLPPEAVRRRPARHIPGASRTRLAAIGGAVLLTTASLVAWFADPGATFGPQGVLWLAGIALLLAACVRWRGGTSTGAGPPWTRLERAAFASLVALALFTFLADLDDLPWRFHYDEAIAYREAMRFHRGPHIPLFSTTWFDTGLPSMWFGLSGSLMHLVGTDLGGVRFSVALAGALTVAPVYGLGRLLVGRAGAFLAAFAWSTSPVVVHYSRVSILNMTTALFWAACFFFLLRGLRSRRPLDFAASGLVAGLSMYTYYGTRLLPPLLLLFGAYLLLAHREAFRERAAELALVPVGFFVGFGPLLAYFLQEPRAWAGRGLSLSVLPRTVPTTWGDLVAIWDVLAPLVRLNFLSLSVIPSNDHVYWDAFLPPAEAVLVLLGFALLVWRWREPAAFLVLSWALGVLLVGGTLIDAVHVPAFNHWTPAFPAFFLAIALPPALLLQALRRVGERWWQVGCCVLGAGLVAVAGLNARTYLVTYPRTVPPAFESAQGRFLAGLAAGERVRFVGNSWLPFFPVVGEMMAPDVRAGDLLNSSRSLPLVPDRQELIFVFNDDQAQYLPLVAGHYPGGARGRISTPGGTIGHTYRVSAPEALARHGVRLTLETAGGRRPWEGRVDSIGTLPDHALPGFPLTATWSGLLFTRERAVGFVASGSESAQVWVRGTAVAPGASIAVDEGWVPFAVRARLTRRAGLRVLLRGAAGRPSQVGRERLWPGRPDAWLAVTLEGGAATAHRIDPFVGAGTLGATGDALLRRRDPDYIPVAAREQRTERIRWLGQLYAEGGEYTMELRTDARAWLEIAGRPALELCDDRRSPGSVYRPGGYLSVPGGLSTRTAVVRLTRGWHDVRLDLEATGIANGLEWTWTRPDHVREIVPPGALRRTAGQAADRSRIRSLVCREG